MPGEAYTGDVAYQDGWHVAVSEDGVLGDRLFLGDDGIYRLAEDGDSSWHERKHAAYMLVVPDGGQAQVAVSGEEMTEIRKMLDERRGV